MRACQLTAYGDAAYLRVRGVAYGGGLLYAHVGHALLPVYFLYFPYIFYILIFSISCTATPRPASVPGGVRSLLISAARRLSCSFSHTRLSTYLPRLHGRACVRGACSATDPTPVAEGRLQIRPGPACGT